MNLHLHFILVNSEFNQGLANDLYQGQESEDNIKHLWEDELQVSEPVQDFKIKNNTTYILQGVFPNEKRFSYEIPEMTVITAVSTNGIESNFAVSKKLIKKTEKVVDEKNNETHLSIYLKDSVKHVNPMNGVYILKTDFPKELNTKQNG